MTITSDLMYRLLVQSVSDYAIYMVDRDGVVLNWNAGAERAKGYTAAEIVGQNFEIFYSEGDRAGGLPQRNLKEAGRTGRISLEGWRVRRDRTSFWASITIDAVYAADGTFLGFAKVTRDLTEQHALMAQFEHQANHDGLTGLLNRSGFFRRLGLELSSGRSLTIYCLDLDQFKPVNDRLGHAAGDFVLQAVAQRLTELTHSSGIVGRMGGDEFVVAEFRVPGTSKPSDLYKRIVRTLGTAILLDTEAITVGVSVGTAHAPEDGYNVTSLLQIADKDLYRAKNNRKNGVGRRQGAPPCKPSYARSV